MKKILLMIAGVVMIAPFFVSAQTVPTTDQFTGAQTTCLDLQYNLSYRSRDAKTNGEVSDLQDFLNTNGYLSVEPTGYFGAATLAAVKKFQSAVGIGSASTPGYGGIGPKSRAKIKAMTCGSTNNTSLNTSTTNTQVIISPSNPTNTNNNSTQTLTGATSATITSPLNFPSVSSQYTISGTASPIGSALDIEFGHSGVMGINSIVQPNGTWSITFPAAYRTGSYPFMIRPYYSGITGVVLASGNLVIGSPATTPTATVSHTPGFVSQNVSPNTPMVKIGSFTAQTNSSGDYTINSMSILIGISSYAITNISNLAIKSGSDYIATPIGNPNYGLNTFSIPNGIVVPSNSSKVFDIYADIGNAPSGSITSNLSFYGNASSPIASSNDGVTITSVINTSVFTSPVTLTAYPLTITSGQSSTVSWNVSGATQCTLSSDNQSIPGPITTGFNGSVTNSLTSTTKYNLLCSVNGSSVSNSITIVVSPVVASVPAVPSFTFITNKTSMVATSSPASYDLLPALSWSSNVSECVISGGMNGNLPGNSSQLVHGFQFVNPPVTTTYTLTCGSASPQSITINVTRP